MDETAPNSAPLTGPDAATAAPQGGSGRPAAPMRERVLDRLIESHRTWFDVDRDRTVGSKTFPGYAEFHSTGERYVLVKRAKLWEVANHEYVFFEARERLGADDYADEVAFMKSEGLSVVQPGPNHMSSNISLVIVADAVDPEVERAVRRTRFRKNHRFGLWGWSDLRVAVVDLASVQRGRQGRVITNAAGKAFRPTIEGVLEPAAQ